MGQRWGMPNFRHYESSHQWRPYGVCSAQGPQGITPEIDLGDNRIHKMMSQAEPEF